MKTSRVLLESVLLLGANVLLWLVGLALYLSVHPEVIQYNVGIT